MQQGKDGNKRKDSAAAAGRNHDGDYYFYNKQLNKSKEFFQKIVELKDVNPKIKIDVERRLNRDFSE